MRKINIILLFLLALALFNSCIEDATTNNMINDRLKMLNIDNSKKIANEVLDKIIKSIENQNDDSLRSIFSKQALSEADAIDERIKYLYQFYKGKEESREITIQTDESIDDENKTVTLNCFCIVKTDVEEYIIFFIDKTIDTLNPDNIGVYMLQIIKLSDRKKYFDWGSKSRCAGIYRPNSKS